MNLKFEHKTKKNKNICIKSMKYKNNKIFSIKIEKLKKYIFKK